tara:strand:- start:967 stop:1239 length:273 start_codon:yes stop_codon:yes gene_type:complete
METLKKSEKIDILERAQKAYWLRGIGGLGDLRDSYEKSVLGKKYLGLVYNEIGKRNASGKGTNVPFGDTLMKILLDIEVEEVDEVLNPKS